MNSNQLSQKLNQAVGIEGDKAWRVLADLSKELKAELADVYEITEIRNETLIGQMMVKVKSKMSPYQLTQADVEKITVSIMNRFFKNELAAERNANNAEYQAKLSAERGEVAQAKESTPKSTIQVNEDVEVKLVKWEGYGKKRVYIKRVGVIAKREDLGMVENGKHTEPKDFDNIRCVNRHSPEWQAVVDAAMAILK